MNYYLDVLKKYTQFSGRASRKEYWMFVLFNAIVAIVISIIDGIIFGKNRVLIYIYDLAVLLPSLAVLCRRLHDTNRSGWWILINLIPVIGWVWYFVLLVLDSTPGDNKYGANPKQAEVKAS